MYKFTKVFFYKWNAINFQTMSCVSLYSIYASEVIKPLNCTKALGTLYSKHNFLPSLSNKAPEVGTICWPILQKKFLWVSEVERLAERSGTLGQKLFMNEMKGEV